MSLKILNNNGNGGLMISNTGANGSFSLKNSVGLVTSPDIVTDGLTLRLDASKTESYDGDGDTWYDLAGTQQNITLVNSPFYSYPIGIPGAFTFYGSNQRGSGTSAVLTTTSYTKSIWFRYFNYQDNNLISSANGGHFMYMNGEDKIYCGHSNWPNYTAYPSTGTFTNGIWYNVTLTFNTTDGMTLYINGDQDSTYTANKDPHNGDSSVNIASFGDGNLFSGQISKVYCYNRSITASEVLHNYNIDKAEFGF
jgi:hypothetical protein